MRRLNLAKAGLLTATLILSGCAHFGSEKTDPATTTVADDTVIQVMSSGGFTAAYKVLGPQFEADTGYILETAFGASSGGASDSIPERLKRGEHADIVILSINGLANITEAGHIDPSSHVDLARSRIGMAVKEGAEVPEIDSVEAFIKVLTEADSIGYSASASGTYLSTVLFPRLGIWEEIEGKSKRIFSERVGAVVARGDVEIGFQQISEILPIEGVTYVGPIPEELQKVTTFSTGIARGTDNPDGAVALIAYLSSRERVDQIEATGLSPVAAEGIDP